MNEWKEILKQDETFQDTRINIKPVGVSGRNLSSKDKEALIDCMEKILEEPGVNPKLKWFARQPFEGKVIACYADQQERALSHHHKATRRRGCGCPLDGFHLLHARAQRLLDQNRFASPQAFHHLRRMHVGWGGDDDGCHIVQP